MNTCLFISQILPFTFYEACFSTCLLIYPFICLPLYPSMHLPTSVSINASYFWCISKLQTSVHFLLNSSVCISLIRVQYRNWEFVKKIFLALRLISTVTKLVWCNALALKLFLVMPKEIAYMQLNMGEGKCKRKSSFSASTWIN